MQRREMLVSGEVYHVFTKSIEKYVIFNNSVEYERMFHLIKYYQSCDTTVSFSRFLSKQVSSRSQSGVILKNKSREDSQSVRIIAYCLMPTHVHLILKQLQDNGITIFMQKILNGFAKFFNLRHKRLGPLWAGRFKSRLIENTEDLLHLTRYLHLNPSTGYLVQNPKDWKYSSYSEYLGCASLDKSLCNWNGVIEINNRDYKKFVDERIDYQKVLARVKHLI